MNGITKEVLCDECGANGSQSTDYCPHCGAEDPWVKEPKFNMDDVEFPVIVEREHYDDNYGLWRDFCYQVFGVHELKSSQIANVPDGLPRMKYCCPSTYWKITENDVDGPYLSRKEAREA